MRECERKACNSGMQWYDGGMYRVCKRIELESGHLLSKHPGNCQFPHGHTRSVELVFSAESLDAHDMVIDFKAISEMLDPFLRTFDHSLCMNTDDPHFSTFREVYGDRIIPFPHKDPTSEAMAELVFQRAQQALRAARTGACSFPVRECVKLERVRVWETSSSWAEYSES